jgi:DNA processing protein
MLRRMANPSLLPPADDLPVLCALACAQGLSAPLLAAAVGAAGSLSAVPSLGAPALAALGWRPAAVRGLLRCDPAQVESMAAAVQRLGLTLLGAHHPAYPAQLRPLADAPAVLFVRGSVAALAAPQLAMVGSRHPTALGRATAREFAYHFAAQGLAITSGLAIGIDGASHEGALAARGLTIAVCGTGLDQCYPSVHAALAERILDSGGALVSEHPPGAPPLASHFPQRNRIISGLSLGVLVVEAAMRSGSLSTARFAGDQNRSVMAVPGSIHSAQSRGCHKLLRDGAALVESAEDVLTEIGFTPSNQWVTSLLIGSETAVPGPDRLDNPAEMLLDALGFEPTSADALIASTGLSSTSVASLLLALELEGRIASDASGRYFRPMAPAPAPRPTTDQGPTSTART